MRETLTRNGLPTAHEAVQEIEPMLHAMRGDKKAVGGTLAFSLLSRVGECKLVEDVPEGLVRRVLEPR